MMRALNMSGNFDRSTAIYSVALLLSALLLFSVQLLSSKLLLPVFGGSPMVWTTAMLFFQTILLFGYFYAHLLTRHFRITHQWLIHSALCGLAVYFFNLQIPQPVSYADDYSIITALLLTLVEMIALPAFVLSATAPLLQSWFAQLGHRQSDDPYFLYAASNVGSFIGLLAYPLAIEPMLDVLPQISAWFVIFQLFFCLLVVTGIIAAMARSAWSGNAAYGNALPPPPPSFEKRLVWLICGFIPASLLLSFTTYITTDIASFPLLWAIPLAVYLMTFVLVFGKRQLNFTAMETGLANFLIIAVIAKFLPGISDSWVGFGFGFLTFAAAAMVFHGRIAAERPHKHYLSEFYLILALGGAMAGVFNSLIAPLLFSGVWEYPIVLAMAAVFLPRSGRDFFRYEFRRSDFNAPLILILSVAAFYYFGSRILEAYNLNAKILLLSGVLFLAAFMFRFAKNRARFAVMFVLMAVWLSNFTDAIGQNTISQQRGFFGVVQVVNYPESNRRVMIHGSTIHGAEIYGSPTPSEPLTYYTKIGPLGQAFDVFKDYLSAHPIAAAGLGVGTVACYGHDIGTETTFFEIDDKVNKIANDPNYFTYLQRCPSKVVIGDARLSLAAQNKASFGLLILDAFSSDSIPMHLLTREAFATYKHALLSDGLIFINASNRYFDLISMIAVLAEDGGFYGAYQTQRRLPDDVKLTGWAPSAWVVLSADQRKIDRLIARGEWSSLPDNTGKPLWTDGFSSIFAALNLLSVK